MWYDNSYRRHLVDMHIADWDDEFLSQFSVEDYIDNLKTAKIQNAMIYLQSHVGLCYFPTEIGVMHKAFVGKEDTMRKLIDRCHEEGIAVTAYYSLNYNTIEHDRHPDWRLLNPNGKSVRDSADDLSEGQDKALLFASAFRARYGLCCLNNKDYREFTYRQIDEMLNYCGDIEGVFFDMPFWNHTCYCKDCRERYLKEMGEELPKDYSFGDKAHQKVMQKKTEWMSEWIQSVTDHVKKNNPNLTVEHNYAMAIAGDSNCGTSVEINDACDFVGGDLYGGIFNHSFACKFYKNITKNMPFDYMFSRCKPGLSMHTLTKTEDEMISEVGATIAHNGATLVIDALDPVGTFDKRLYDRIGKVLGKFIPYEKHLNGTMAEDIGIYYGLMSRFSPSGLTFNNKTAGINVNKTLIGKHIPFGVTGNFYKLDDYKVLIAPLLTSLEKSCDRLISYVENGGKLYFSGADNPELLSKLLSAKLNRYTAERRVYIAPEVDGVFMDFTKKYPLPFNDSAPILDFSEDVEVLATLTLPYTIPSEVKFASIHSDPPGKNTGLPMVVRKKVGKGEVIWSAVPIEAVDMYEYCEIFTNILSLFGTQEYSFYSDAPATVEVTLFNSADGKRVNVCDLSELPVATTVVPFTVSVKCDSKPKAVRLLPNGKKVPFKYKDGYVTFTVKDLKIFAMYQIV